MQWEGSWRQLEASSRQTSFAVREQSGHSFKSALRHIMTVDHRDHPIFPSSGVLLKLVQEYAGLGGDVAFVKHDSELQANVPLPQNLVWISSNINFKYFLIFMYVCIFMLLFLFYSLYLRSFKEHYVLAYCVLLMQRQIPIILVICFSWVDLRQLEVLI